MNEKLKKVEKKNVELTLSDMKREVVVVTKRLTKLYSEENQKKEELSSLENEKEELLKGFEDIKNKCDGEKSKIDQERNRLKDETLSHVKNVRDLKEIEKLLNKKISRLNKWILSAENSLEEISSKKKTLKKEVEALISEAKEVDRIKKDLPKLQKEQEELVRKTADVNIALKEEHYIFVQAIASAKKEVENLKQKKDQLSKGLSRLNDEYSRKAHDLKIYEDRVRKEYAKVFPGKLMRLK